MIATSDNDLDEWYEGDADPESNVGYGQPPVIPEPEDEVKLDHWGLS